MHTVKLIIISRKAEGGQALVQLMNRTEVSEVTIPISRNLLYAHGRIHALEYH